MYQRCLIDEAVTGDIDAILDIENICFTSDRFSRQQFKYLITASKGVFYVVRIDRRVVAYLSLLAGKRTKKVRIYSIAVHPAQRGHGIAQALIAKAVAYATANGFNGISLEVKTTNYEAISLYKKMGFKNTAIKTAYYADGCDAFKLELCY